MKKATFYAIACTTFFFFGETSEAQNTSPYWSMAGNSNASPSSKLGTTGNTSLRFYTNNVQRVIINSVEGYIGIGTPTPDSKVHINSASGQIPLRVQVNASTKFLVNGNGRVGIGTTSPKSTLDVAGTITGFASYFGKTYPVSAGTSGASYSSVGYGLTFSDTTANYRYRLNDFSSMLSFRAGGFDFNTAPFGTAGTTIPYTTAMAILQNGNVGIGTTTPAYKLSVLAAPANATPAAYIENTNRTGLADGLWIKAGTDIAFPASSFIRFLRPDGTIVGTIFQVTPNTIQYSTTSDKRLKNIVGTTQKGLSDLMKIKIYDYTFKSDPNKEVQTGFMAQELYDIFPQAVSKPKDTNEPAEKNPWMVDYGRVTPLIIKSVQEQQQVIDELKEKNTTLEERIIKLEAALASITANNNGTIYNGSLEQNNPNPFTKNTTIRYSIPQGSKGQINIYDQAGKLVKILNANAGGQSQVTGHELAAGAYTYTLMVDGKVALSKQMLIIK